MVIMKVKDQNGNIVNVPLGVGGGTTSGGDAYETSITDTVSGNPVVLTDISPLDHKINIQLKSKNLWNFSIIKPSNSITMDSYGNLTFPERGSGTFYFSYPRTLRQLAPELEVGKTYTISYTDSSNSFKGLRLVPTWESGLSDYVWSNNTALRMTDIILDAHIQLYKTETSTPITVSNFQIKEETEASAFTPHISNFENIKVYKNQNTSKGYLSNKDGVVDNIFSSYPYTSLQADSDAVYIDCEYLKRVGLDYCAEAGNIALNNENVINNDISPRISALETYVYNSDPSLLGLEVDFVNNKFTRLCGAKNLSPGEDFNRFKMYGQRRRCNVDDNGNILNFYGDEEATPCEIKIYDGEITFPTTATAINAFDKNTGNLVTTNMHFESIESLIYHQLKGIRFPSPTIVDFNLSIETALGVFNLPVKGLEPGIPLLETIENVGQVYLKVDGETTGTDENKIYNYTGKFEIGVSPAVYTYIKTIRLTISTINIYNYNETGMHGQVMVYQPKFYYQIVPVDVNTTSSGVNKLNKVRYYICDNPIPGFKLHPAFYDKNGNEVNYILYSAYEGTRMNMEKGFAKESDLRNIIDFNLDYDVLCSVAGQQPASGMRDNLTKTNFEKIAQNRGENWHIETAQAVAANQLLMMIEYGKLNLQEEIGLGVTTINGYINTAGVIRNGSVFTGSTTELGNSTGSATMSTRLTPGFYDTDYSNMFTEELIWNGTRSISYRGMENPWGNIFKFINGLTVNAYGLVYINPDHLNNIDPILTNSKMTGYGGYISKFNYIQDYDWLFIPIETTGSSAEPVGDFYTAGFGSNTSFYYGGRYFYDTSSSNGYSGIFCLSGQVDENNNTFHRGDIGARLIYVPTADVEEV